MECLMDQVLGSDCWRFSLSKMPLIYDNEIFLRGHMVDIVYGLIYVTLIVLYTFYRSLDLLFCKFRNIGPRGRLMFCLTVLLVLMVPLFIY